ncbi:ABC transporter substrate-binding protein [Aliidongia dinghuensis]|uniref:ABC transporter substrate-binding protein n=1 Tax=Aliidongia dinghuensis TaxID=1867774 RepID=A0A8J2YWA6_9PROT|nr:transporter substrate-binding domain-containing protein [Aliidongia dinghuensis]GGF31185.1 ABC transporter substrate-binding protein [Aliidongia dinghuensis]
MTLPFRLLSACLALLAAFVAGIARADMVTIAACENYAPYSDASLPGDGFANDLTARIMSRAGYDVSVTIMPWVRALQGTETGTFDILPSAWYTEARGRTLLFSQPIALSRLVFVKPVSSPFEFHSLDDLRGLTVGTVSGYAYTPDFLTSPLFQRTAVADIVLNLRMVAARRIDLTLDDELTLRFIIHSRAPELAPLLSLTRGVLSEQPLYVAFSRTRPDAERLVAAFDAGLARMQADGDYQRLLALHQME